MRLVAIHRQFVTPIDTCQDFDFKDDDPELVVHVLHSRLAWHLIPFSIETILPMANSVLANYRQHSGHPLMKTIIQKTLFFL